MKKFITKFIYYQLILIFSLIVFLLAIFKLQKSDKICFLSNSISLNAKLAFLKKNQNTLSTSKYTVLGSSMSLNNIDCSLLSEKLSAKVINISAWGMKVIDFEKLIPLINGNSKILINLSFVDLKSTDLVSYFGFPSNYKLENLNKGLYLKNYLSQIQEIQFYTEKNSNQTYQCLQFDNCGSLLLAAKDFKFRPKRWEDSPKIPTSKEIEQFIDQLRIFDNFEVFLFFSPERVFYSSQSKYLNIQKLKGIVESKYKNIRVFNNYNVRYQDSLFADCTHFNINGAKQYTQLISGQLLLNR